MRRSSLVLFAASFLSATIHAMPPIEQRMSAEELRATGIARLTAEELAALNAWLERERGRPAAAVAGAGSDATGDAARREPERAADPAAASGTAEQASAERSWRLGFRREQGERVAVVSRIAGEFSGWTGRSVFKLANGQVWQQTDGERWSTRTLRDPEVVIEPKAFGSWLMRVAPSNRTVRVTRIE